MRGIDVVIDQDVLIRAELHSLSRFATEHDLLVIQFGNVY